MLKDLINHLVIHKAVISEEDGEYIDRYMEILESVSQGKYRSITDPVDRTISLVFELVLEHQMDPWDIDLIKFCNIYLEKVRKERYIDLVTGGRLMLMAWNILKMQTEEALNRALPPQMEETLDFSMEWFETEQDFDFTEAVKRSPTPPIQPRIMRKGERPVTLIELVDAFREASEEAERRRKAFETRRSRMARMRRLRVRTVGNMLHKEDLSEDISEVWKRINRFNGIPISLTDIWSGDRDELIVILMSILFLANDGKIRIWQEDFPFGMIYIQNLISQDVLETGS